MLNKLKMIESKRAHKKESSIVLQRAKIRKYNGACFSITNEFFKTSRIGAFVVKSDEASSAHTFRFADNNIAINACSRINKTIDIFLIVFETEPRRDPQRDI